jgi:hypothetical protein
MDNVDSDNDEKEEVDGGIFVLLFLFLNDGIFFLFFFFGIE